MAQQQQIKASDDKELHWFWRVTTTWYFFPLMYLSLALIALILKILFIEYDGVYLDIFLVITYFSTSYLQLLEYLLGVFHLSTFFIFGRYINYSFFVWAILFHIIIFLSSPIIYYYRLKHKKILKFLIILILSFLFLSFILTLYSLNNIKGMQAL